MAEGRMTQIVRQGDRFGQRFVQCQRARDGATDLRDLERVGHAGAEQVALVVDEYLGLVSQAAKGTGVNDTVAVALEFAAVLRRRLGVAAGAGAVLARPARGAGP